MPSVVNFLAWITAIHVADIIPFTPVYNKLGVFFEPVVLLDEAAWLEDLTDRSDRTDLVAPFGRNCRGHGVLGLSVLLV